MSRWRGHAIQKMGARWVYSDSRLPVALRPDRPCGFCRAPNTAHGHDACFGQLPGVMNACCGHGETKDAYVQMCDGRRFAGRHALQIAAGLLLAPPEGP